MDLATRNRQAGGVRVGCRALRTGSYLYAVRVCVRTGTVSQYVPVRLEQRATPARLIPTECSSQACRLPVHTVDLPVLLRKKKRCEAAKPVAVEDMDTIVPVDYRYRYRRR
jgi:hypothetical protein